MAWGVRGMVWYWGCRSAPDNIREPARLLAPDSRPSHPIRQRAGAEGINPLCSALHPFLWQLYSFLLPTPFYPLFLIISRATSSSVRSFITSSTHSYGKSLLFMP